MEAAMPIVDLRQLLFLVGCMPVLGCTGQEMPAGPDTGTTVAPSDTNGPTTAGTPTTTATTTTTTTDTSTSALPGDASTDVSTNDEVSTNTGVDTMGISKCGNGIVDAGEECDDSLAGNDDSRFCKSDCTLNVCGDGKLFVNWELCDEGPANSDAYGSLCGTQCKPGARCGDNLLQPEFETCDLGLNNGGRKGDNQGILCDKSCRALQLRGFVTKSAFDGALGGPFGADLKCRSAAAAAGLIEPERFHAYLSTDDLDAKERFEDVAASWTYVLVTGKKFADNFAALIEAGPLGEGILVTEYGDTLYTESVATNTAPGGISFSPDQDCQGWTSADPAFKARVGLTAVPVNSPDADAWKDEQWWTGIKSWQCDKPYLHLYCLEI